MLIDIEKLKNSQTAMLTARKGLATILWTCFFITFSSGVNLRHWGIKLSISSPERIAYLVAITTAAALSVWGRRFLKPELDLLREKTPQIHGRAFLLAAIYLLFMPAFFIYTANETFTASWDTAPTRYLALSLIGEQNFDLDEFSELTESDTSGYFLRRNSQGKSFSSYPPGSGLLALPVYTAGVIVNGWPQNPRRVLELEKTAAGFLTALAVFLFFLSARSISGFRTSITATFIFAFGTNIFATCSQALWQHTGGVMLVCAGISCLLSAQKNNTKPGLNLAVSGFLFGAALICRSVNIVPAALAGAYVLYRHGFKNTAAFTLGAVPAALVLMGYNFSSFGSVLGSGYYGNASNADLFWTAPSLSILAGLLISPARGLFVFSPVLVFAFIGIAKAITGKDENKDFFLFCTACTTGITGVLMCWKIWWGGWCFGPRLMTDLLPFAALLLIPAIKTVKDRKIIYMIFTFCLAFSVFIQFEGVYSNARQWDRHANLDKNPGAAWGLPDTQILYPFRSKQQ